MKKLFTFLMIAVVLMGASSLNAQDVEITFNVNLATFADTSDFDPAVDMVYVSGEVLEADWSEPGTVATALMTDDDGDLTYTWSATLPADSSYQYKFFYVPDGMASSWDYGEWTGGDNRVLEVGAENMSLFEMWGIYSQMVTFNVNMATFADTSDFDPAVDMVYISGEVLGADWQEPGTYEMAHMTDEDGDFTYTWSAYLPQDSSYQYKYFYVPDGMASSWDYGEWAGGDNRMVQVGMESMTLVEMWGIYSQMVTFNVDMATFADTSDFDAAVDMVYISGEVLGTDWSEPGTNVNAHMMDEDGDLTYTWSTYLPQDSSYQYKYFYVPDGEESSWDYGEWNGGDNRIVEVMAEDKMFTEMWGMFKIMFLVTSDGTTPLADATVTAGDMSETTGAEGMATLYGFPTDSVVYTVSHADYADYQSGVQLNYADADVLVSMETSGIGEGFTSEFKMFPNPSTDVLNIEGLENITKVEVYNTVGQRVRVIDNVNTANVQITTGDLQTGIYFVNFYTDRSIVATQKFMKR